MIKYKLRSWLNIDNVDWKWLSSNPHEEAIRILGSNLSRISYRNLLSNPAAIRLIDRDMDMDMDMEDWRLLSCNPGAIYMLKKYPENISWWFLSANYNAIDLLEKRIDSGQMDTLDWIRLSGNKNAVHILKKNRENINWYYLSKNPNAMDLLMDNPTMINYHNLLNNTNPYAIKIINNMNQENINWVSLSSNPAAISILENNIDNIWWPELSKNPGAIHILESNIDKINIYTIWSNPSIFTYDYKYLKEAKKLLHTELYSVLI